MVFAAITPSKAQSLSSVAALEGTAYLTTVDGEQVYVSNKVSDRTYTLYNATTFEREWGVTAPEQSGMTFQTILHASRNTVDDDNTVEYFAMYYDNTNSQNVIWLYGQDVPQRFDGMISLSINVIDGKFYAAMINTGGYTFIYELDGEPTGLVDNSSSTTTSTSYPNPASEFMTITYDLKGQNAGQCMIYDASGKLVQHLSLGDAFSQVRVDVSGYKPGVYMYVINGVVNRFVVK